MFLNDIIEKKKQYLSNRKKDLPFSCMKVNSTKYSGSIFSDNLKSNSINIIAEIKKASPSKGIFLEDFEPVKMIKQYEAGGAKAVSILTEVDYFLGSPEMFADLRTYTKLPLLRKDFIIDEYQIYESAYLGANALLLIVKILDEKELKDFLKLTYELDMAALVEVHNESELDKALSCGAKIIGINSRDLKTFKIDKEKMKELIALMPGEIVKVAESGIKDKDDILSLKSAGADAFLVGETLVKSNDAVGLLKNWTK